MNSWTPARVAQAAGAQLVRPGTSGEGPSRAVIDSRGVSPTELFVGLRGARVDGGSFARDVLRGGAWGALVSPDHAAGLADEPGVVLASPDPLDSLQKLAHEWRRELGARVIAITGSTGKTSTKDILAALLGGALVTVASRQNLNTEIGLPLAILEAPAGTEVLVLELAMRGRGQIAQLTEICEPDVGVIVNVGPVHLSLLGTVENVAAAKAELIAGMAPGTTAVLPAREPLLDAHRRADLDHITFGSGGDVSLGARHDDGRVTVLAPGLELELEPAFSQAHNLDNLLAAVAAALAVGVTPRGRVDVTFSALRGERLTLPGRIILVNDCYNANPMSMRAALDDLAATADARRVAVLGDMLELGPEELRFHRQVGEHARRVGVDLLITVGALAGEIGRAFGPHAHAVSDAEQAAQRLRELLQEGDTVLVKGSRGVGLEVIAQALTASRADP